MRAFASAALGAAMLGAAQAATVHHYTVRVDPSLERLAVHACFDGGAPAALAAESDGASLYLEDMRVRDAPEAKIAIRRREALLANVPENACIDYAVALRPSTSGALQGSGPETRRIGRHMLTSFGDWLWRPKTMRTDEDVELRFVLPAAVRVSAPWRSVGPDGEAVFRIGPAPFDWPGVVAFGAFEPVQFEVAGVHVELALLDDAPRIWVADWIANAVRGIATAYGRFPVGRLQVVVAPVARGRGPVPWAYVSRGGGSAVHLFINPAYPPREFELDWSATHEMSHLFLPYVDSRDAWLYEGLPTYYQNVLMARGGAITVDDGWLRLYGGLRRAEELGRGLALSQAAQQILRPGMYRRVYWGGAAMLLEADLRLRAQGGSLDAALEALGRCCLDEPRRWRAEEILARLDAAAGSSVFTDVYREMYDRPVFPDFDAMFARAGVDVFGGEVKYSGDESARKLREGIMSPR
ncbi:MAG TPA: hypothetical protein VFB20_15355 [Burkholderiales bacterium]|nr:hypothetical protein [Burkholderiales bacterium]